MYKQIQIKQLVSAGVNEQSLNQFITDNILPLRATWHKNELWLSFKYSNDKINHLVGFKTTRLIKEYDQYTERSIEHALDFMETNLRTHNESLNYLKRNLEHSIEEQAEIGDKNNNRYQFLLREQKTLKEGISALGNIILFIQHTASECAKPKPIASKASNVHAWESENALTII
jgi:hypothetical protein